MLRNQSPMGRNRSPMMRSPMRNGHSMMNGNGQFTMNGNGHSHHEPHVARELRSPERRGHSNLSATHPQRCAVCLGCIEASQPTRTLQCTICTIDRVTNFRWVGRKCTNASPENDGWGGAKTPTQPPKIEAQWWVRKWLKPCVIQSLLRVRFSCFPTMVKSRVGVGLLSGKSCGCESMKHVAAFRGCDRSSWF